MPECDLFCNFIETTFRHGCFPVNLLYILRIPFPKNTSGGLLLEKFPRGRMFTPSLTSCIVLSVSLDFLEDLYIKYSKEFFQGFLWIFVHFFLLWENIIQL